MKAWIHEQKNLHLSLIRHWTQDPISESPLHIQKSPDFSWISILYINYWMFTGCSYPFNVQASLNLDMASHFLQCLVWEKSRFTVGSRFGYELTEWSSPSSSLLHRKPCHTQTHIHKWLAASSYYYDRHSELTIQTVVPTAGAAGEAGVLGWGGSHFSDITVSTCSNLACRSSAATLAPRLPHKNFKWNSVWNASVSNSSTLESPRTISAFRRNIASDSPNLRADSICENNIPRPKSVVDSQGPRQLTTTVVLPLGLMPAKEWNILLMQLL